MSNWLNILGARLRGLAGRERVIRDIDEELRFHVEMETEENVRRGMAPGEARRVALRSFGNVCAVRDAAYEVRGGGMLESILRDARYGARALAKNKGFTAVAVLTLALGIGANAAIFAVIDAVLLRPLPYPEPGRLVKLYAIDPAGESFAVSPADFLEGYSRAQAFEHLAAYREFSFNMASQELPERVSGVVVSPEFFSVMGVVAGLLVALALSRLATSMLYGVEAADPLTLLAVSAVLICVTAAACLVPARRAARIDPLVALKYE